jgi:RNA polymerase sigma factor (sigma-70 family)
MFLTTNPNKEKKINDSASLPDEEILALARKQPKLFEILVERYQEMFIRKALRITGKQEDAEDVVQETFVKIFIHADKFKTQEGASFKSWGYRILVNTCFTYYKKLKLNKERFLQLDPELEGILPDKDSAFEKYTLSEYILSVTSKMPDSLGKVLEDYFIKGISQKELANQENVSISAIKTRVHRAKKAFKKISNSFVS